MGESDLIIVANRLPVRRRRRQGRDVWDTSPGGLVSALMPILGREAQAGRGGAWIGWSGVRTRSFAPFEHEGVRNTPVNLSKQQIEGYYDGMANGALWPLYHDLVRAPRFTQRWWRIYRDVNRTFAAAAEAAAAPGASVWVHDYHLHLVPRMLREARPDLRIGFFLHIPFPPARLFAQLPWRREILEGTLGADVIGFQTASDAAYFIESAQRYTDAAPAEGGVRSGERAIRIDGFPISIDSQRIDELARSAPVASLVALHRRRLGHRRILLGVDRLDYTKGIPHRLRAFQQLLRSGRVKPEQVVFVQSCVPTRERVRVYASLCREVEELVSHINGEFGDVGLNCVHYLRQNLPLEELVALYVAADVAVVTPVRDGMNLIAKEYVASRHDESGALVLSEHTGAAEELLDALIVNPHDLDATAAAMDRALHLDPDDARRRMVAMREAVFARDVYVWADGFMSAMMRQQERSLPRRSRRVPHAAAAARRVPVPGA